MQQDAAASRRRGKRVSKLQRKATAVEDAGTSVLLSQSMRIAAGCGARACRRGGRGGVVQLYRYSGLGGGGGGGEGAVPHCVGNRSTDRLAALQLNLGGARRGVG